MSVFGTASSIYRCPSFFLCFVHVFSLSRWRISILLPVAPRWFQRNDEGGVGWGYPGGFCPAFVSSSNYDLPHEYEPYVSIRAPSLLPSPVFDLFHRSVFSFSRSLFCLFLFFPPISPFLSFPVTAARTSFRAPWGCKCIRDDGRVLPE